MSKVFISYARNDGQSAQRLYEDLCVVGNLEPWLDVHNLPAGARLRPAIRKAIREADYFVALISKHSASEQGFRHSELEQALEILGEFPDDKLYLIPARLDECHMPREKLNDLAWVDLFPDWKVGIQKLCASLAPFVTGSSRAVTAPPPLARNQYHYRVGLVDLDLGLTNLSLIAQRLNDRQNYFQFMCPKMPSLETAVVKIEGDKHLAIYDIPKSFIEEHRQLSVDLVSCFTKFPLAFFEKGRYYWYYFAGPSDKDERFLFVSTDQLWEFCKKAGRTFEAGLVHILVSQLTAYFTTLGYHHQTRGCVMDFCKIRNDQILGLKARKFCKSCDDEFPNGELKDALNAMLLWEY